MLVCLVHRSLRRSASDAETATLILCPMLLAPRNQVALLLLLFAPGYIAAELASNRLTDPMEIAVVTAIENRSQQDHHLLVRTVNINSGTLNLKGVREVGMVFEQQFQDLGFTTRWIDGEAFERAGHLVAEFPGNDTAVARSHFLLIGHLDTVFEPDSPFQEAEIIVGHDALLKGPGTTDMKGGNVVMLAALRGLKEAGVLATMQITVILTGDEEKVGNPLEISRAELLRLGNEADIALGFEDGDGNPATAVVARRGSSRWQLEVEGVSSHSSQVFQPQVGAGAIYELARVLNAFRTELADLEDLTYSPGVILGGTETDFDSEQGRGTAFGKNNVVAQTAVASGDIRATSPEQLAEARRRMEQIVSQALPQTNTRLVFENRYPPMGASGGNLELLEIYNQASIDLGAGPVEAVNPRNAGAADIAFVAAEVEMALDGIGLMGHGGHTVEETANLDNLPVQAARTALTMMRVARARAASQ